MGCRRLQGYSIAMVRTLSLAIWILYFSVSAISIAAFALWTHMNRVQTWIVRGLLPGVVGFPIGHLILFLSQVLVSRPDLSIDGELWGLSLNTVLWAWFVNFLLLLVWGDVARPWGRGLGILAGAVSLLGALSPWGPPEWKGMVLTGLGLFTLAFGVFGVVTSALLKVSSNDVREKVELKHLFQPIVTIFFCLLPLVFIDLLWSGPEPAFGLKYTVGAIQFFIFAVIYLRFFTRWVLYRVGESPSSEVSSPRKECPRDRSNDVSPREREIILLIASGLTNKEIAGELFISPATVKNHIYSIFSKANVKSRIQLLKWWTATD
jgi:DNA-binding CsgD family transcriptional regulator